MSNTYLLNSSVILRYEPQYYDTYIAFNYKTVTTEYLTHEEYRVLECIYQQSSNLDQISSSLKINNEKCKKFINRLIKRGYITLKNASSHIQAPSRINVPPILFKKFYLPFLSAPTSVDIFITNRCNLNCIHCFSSKEDIKNRTKSIDISISDLNSLFNHMEEIGVLEIRLNGGEPFLHPNIIDIFKILQGRRFRKVVLTNGSFLDKDRVILLKEFEITPTVSLDDSTSANHDLFRRAKGSFFRTIEALKLLKQNNVTYGINCCLHKENLYKYRDIIELAIKYGAYKIAFLDLKYTGRMKKYSTWIPSYHEYEKILPQLILAKIKYRKKIDVALGAFLHCYPLKETLKELQRGYVSCQAGKNSLSIDSTGSVYPCNLVISDPRWCMGNITNEKLLDIWFSTNWSFFRGAIQIDNLTMCRKCKQMNDCVDIYCRLLPYQVTGDAYGSHPKCIQSH